MVQVIAVDDLLKVCRKQSTDIRYGKSVGRLGRENRSGVKGGDGAAAYGGIGVGAGGPGESGGWSARHGTLEATYRRLRLRLDVKLVLCPHSMSASPLKIQRFYAGEEKGKREGRRKVRNREGRDARARVRAWRVNRPITEARPCTPRNPDGPGAWGEHVGRPREGRGDGFRQVHGDGHPPNHGLFQLWPAPTPSKNTELWLAVRLPHTALGAAAILLCPTAGSTHQQVTWSHDYLINLVIHQLSASCGATSINFQCGANAKQKPRLSTNLLLRLSSSSFHTCVFPARMQLPLRAHLGGCRYPVWAKVGVHGHQRLDDYHSTSYGIHDCNPRTEHREPHMSSKPSLPLDSPATGGWTALASPRLSPPPRVPFRNM